MRFLITGGGTGGHVYPGITIAQAIRDKLPEAEILYIGSRQGLEADVVPRAGFRLETIPLIGLPRQISPRILKAVWLAGRGVAAAGSIIREFQPDVVVGTGGYVCGPVLLAACLYRVPVAIQEQNAFPGLTNRMLSRFARRVFLAYEEAARFFDRRKIMVCGNPIRPSITEINRRDGAGRLGLDPSLTTLLVVGASQGARSINQALLTGLPSLLLQPRLQILHITGKRNYETVQEAMAHLHLAAAMAARVKTVPYLYDMPDAYAVADLVLSRAGAISLAEMTAKGLPLLLVPLPHAAADHQTYNARALATRGAAKLIPDHELSGERILSEVTMLLKDQPALAQMRRASAAAGRPQAVAEIVAELERLGRNGGPWHRRGKDGI